MFSNFFICQLWEDHPGQPSVVRHKISFFFDMTHCILSCDLALNLNCNLNWQAPKEEGKKKKKGGGKTVSSVYLLSLMELMAQVSEGSGSYLENAPILSLNILKMLQFFL